MRTMFRLWIAKKPSANPMKRCLHGAGKAKIAANRMMMASTPLQPRSIATPQATDVLWMTLP